MRAMLVSVAAVLSLSLLPGLANAQGCGGGYTPPVRHGGKHAAQPAPRDSHAPMDPRTHRFIIEVTPGDGDRRVDFHFGFGTRDRETYLPPPPPTPAAPDDDYVPPADPDTYEVQDKKVEKRVVKKALLVGVGRGKVDPEVSKQSVEAIALALPPSWGFPEKGIDQLLNKAATKAAILRKLDALIADAKAEKPEGLEAYFVVVYLQGHSTDKANPAKAKDLVNGTAAPKGVEKSVAFAAVDWTEDLQTGFIYPFELQNRLDALSQALLKLEQGGAKTGVIVQMDACYAEAYFDGWRGSDGKGALPSNVYAGWSAGRTVQSKYQGMEKPNGEVAGAATPFARGFADQLGPDGNGGDLHPSVQDALKGAADRANRANKGEGQGAGSAAGNATPLVPSEYPKNKKT